MRVTCFILAVISLTQARFTPIVKVSEGRLVGVQSALSGQFKYFGIPYAVSKRFQLPQPPPKWNEIFYATNPATMCAQTLQVPLGSENCNTLNIYSPPIDDKTNKIPVMVFIHGGAYFSGSGSVIQDPEYLVNHGVIVVSINYRLGVLGFLCLRIKELPANLGLKDQLAALNWIKNNIAAFGGNPENITLFGESADSSSALHHMLSNSSGLFHRVILESGSVLSSWALNPDDIQFAKDDVKKLGYSTENSQKIFEVFKNASLFDLLAATKDDFIHTHYKYVPCVEHKVYGDDFAIVKENPFKAMKEGRFQKLPVMIGLNNIEGYLFYSLHNVASLQDMDKNFTKYMPLTFRSDSKSILKLIEKKLRKRYFKGGSILQNDKTGLVDYYSDAMFISSVPITSKIIIHHSNAAVYNYLFTYDGSRNFMKSLFQKELHVKGATHLEELFYLFKPLSLPLPVTSYDGLIINRITTMWANFAKYSNPTPLKTKLLPVTWHPSNSTRSIYMKIDLDMKMIEQPFRERERFWMKLLNDYGQPGFLPNAL